MATILERLLTSEISSEDVISWVTEKLADVPENLLDCSNLKQEFIPLFLNYLRDQTLHLIHSHSSASTPAKTPLSSKFKRQFSRRDSTSSEQATSTQIPKSDLATKKNVSYTNNTVYENRKTGTRKSTDNAKNESLGSNDSPAYTRRNSYSMPKSRNRRSLGDFFNAEANNKSRKSPNSESQSAVSQSMSTPKHSNGRKNKHSWRQAPVTDGPPELNLSDCEEFPSLGGALKTSTPKRNEKILDLPDGATVINPPRRVTTTLMAPPSRPDTANCWSSHNSLNGSRETTVKPAGNLPVPNFEYLKDYDNKFSKRLGKCEDTVKRCESTVLNSRSPAPDETNSEFCSPIKKIQSIVSIQACAPSKDGLPKAVELIKTSPDLVTYQRELDVLADLYSSFINEQLISNLSLEIYFILQLLTCKGQGEQEKPSKSEIVDADEVQYFSSVHNAIYFAVLVISKQRKLFALLDKATIGLLSENQRLVDFNPELHQEFVQVYNCSPGKLPQGLQSPPQMCSVSFQADLENRSNFPNDRSFNCFRKQRDGLFELIRCWEANHLKPGWSLVEDQGLKVHQLVTQKVELTTHIHFARLFQSQLVHMCKIDNSWSMEGDDDQIQLLGELKQANPEKYKRLQERFITPSSQGGPCPQPGFTGCQEFFRDFIVAANCSIFHQHLKDSLQSNLVQLNSSHVRVISDSQDEQEEYDHGKVQQSLADTLITCRLLAKFLGFLHFWPYQSLPQVRLPDKFLSTWMHLRNQVQPGLDLVSLLQHSWSHGHSVLTVPWVVEYLSMADKHSLNLQHYESATKHLVAMYRNSSNHYGEGLTRSELLCKMTIGWLMELGMFADGLFHQQKSALPTLPPLDKQKDRQLDDSDMVDQALLYRCCPYLYQTRAILVEFTVGAARAHTTVRKITPVLTQVPVPAQQTERNMQALLEEAFFHNHRAYLKESVEFVAKRTASNYIKHLRSNVLGEVMKTAQCQATKAALETLQNRTSQTTAKLKADQMLHNLSHELWMSFRSSALADCQLYCSSMVEPVLTILCPDITLGVLQCALGITVRMAGDRVTSWINMYINQAMFRKEMHNWYEKQLSLHQLHLSVGRSLDDIINDTSLSDISCSFLSIGESSQHCGGNRCGSWALQEDNTFDSSGLVAVRQLEVAAASASEVRGTVDYNKYSEAEEVVKLKAAVCCVVCNRNISESVELFSQALNTITEMFAVNKTIFKGVAKCTAHLIAQAVYHIMLCHPAVFTEKLSLQVRSFWEDHAPSDFVPPLCICPKHIMKLMTADNQPLAWQHLTEFGKALIKSDFMDMNTLQQGFSTVFERFWQQDPMTVALNKETEMALNNETLTQLCICVGLLFEALYGRTGRYSVQHDSQDKCDISAVAISNKTFVDSTEKQILTDLQMIAHYCSKEAQELVSRLNTLCSDENEL